MAGKGDSYYRFFPGKYLSATLHLTILEHGVYRLLLDLAYLNGGRIPNDQAKLERSLRAKYAAEREAIKKITTEFFREQGPYLVNPKALSEVRSRRAFLLRQSYRGSRSAAKRKEKRLNHTLGSTKDLVQPRNEEPAPLLGLPVLDQISDSEAAPGTELALFKDLDLRSLKSLKSTSSSKDRIGKVLGKEREGDTKNKKPTPKNPSNGHGVTWDQKFDGITGDMLDLWEKAYPACNIPAQLYRMDEWLKANPDKRKKNYYRFITNWLARAQERGGDKNWRTKR